MSILDEHIEAIQALCIAFHVRQLDVFGAIAGDSDELSEDEKVLFAVAFEPSNPRAHYERFFGLHQGLEILLTCPVELLDYAALRESSCIRRLPEIQRMVYKCKDE